MWFSSGLTFFFCREILEGRSFPFQYYHKLCPCVFWINSLPLGHSLCFPLLILASYYVFMHIFIECTTQRLHWVISNCFGHHCVWYMNNITSYFEESFSPTTVTLHNVQDWISLWEGSFHLNNYKGILLLPWSLDLCRGRLLRSTVAAALLKSPVDEQNSFKFCLDTFAFLCDTYSSLLVWPPHPRMTCRWVCEITTAPHGSIKHGLVCAAEWAMWALQMSQT